MKFKLVLLAATAASVVSGTSASAAILVNGDFESPGGDPVRDTLTTHYLTGWTYTAGPSLDIYESDDQDGLLAADGTHYVSFGHNGSSGGSISQDFATVAGRTYTLRYSVAEQQGVDASQVLRATVTSGAQVLSRDANPTSSWVQQSLSFVASDSTATVTFLDATPPGGGASSNLTLDAVSVTAAGAAPEPSSWAMMLLGVGGLGGMMRNRRRRPAGLAA